VPLEENHPGNEAGGRKARPCKVKEKQDKKNRARQKQGQGSGRDSRS